MGIPGKLLLAHMQKAPLATSAEASEELPIKNTFIHFERPRHPALARHRTEPSPQARQYVSSSTTGSGASTPTSDGKEFDSHAMAAVMNMLETKDTPSPKEHNSLALAAVMNMFAGGDACLDAQNSPSPKDAVQSELNTSIARWNVDSRRFLGRDTRISSTMQPMVGAGPACADIVVTIFPASVSNKRGGACFKAANGTGSIQLKCNNPVDVMLSVCIGVGSETARFQRHNFFRNPLMTFDSKWDFWDYIDRNADRSTVAVSLQLLEAEDVVDSCTIPTSKVAPDLIDPAIVSFSFSGKAVPELAPELSFNWEADTTISTKRAHSGVHFGDFDEYEEGDFSPDVTPRTPPQAMQAAWPPTLAQQPPPSPFFSLEGSALFSFTLRRADTVMLGLDVNRDEHNQELVVERVIPGGAAESWNRQCFAGPFSSKAVVPEDRIVSINGRRDCAGMLEECRHNQLLKLFVVRGDLAHEKIPLAWCGAATPQPTIQYVAVPILFPIPCVKHELVDCNGGFAATGAEQFGTGAASFGCAGALWSGVPEYFPPASIGQDDGGDVTDDDGGW